MVNFTRSFRGTRYFVVYLLALCFLLMQYKALAVTWPGVESDWRQDANPALGIGTTFGRWNRTIYLVYDPDDAPQVYRYSPYFIALLEQAVAQWEHVSGVHIDVLPPDAGIITDRNLPFAQRDELVKVYWGANDNSFSGRAGPLSGRFDNLLGYSPYHDGDIELSTYADVFQDSSFLVEVLVHELGHLLGLGHSDNQNSVMFANPYNFLVLPRPDDIRAMQVLYGPPEVRFPVEQPLKEWMYKVPPLAPDSVTRYLFKPNQRSANAAYLSLATTPFSILTKQMPDEDFVRINSGGIGNAENPDVINISASVILVDPGGYVRHKYPWSLTCAARVACAERISSSIQSRSLKTLPGLWKVYVVDESQGAETAVLLLALNFKVEVAQTLNKPPVAKLAVEAGFSPTVAILKLTAIDPELLDMSVIWHSPGQSNDNRNSVKSGDTVSHSIDFIRTGTYTLFVEVNDGGVRYVDTGPYNSYAGSGFQTLLKVTVTLPITSPASITVVSTQPSPNESWGTPASTSARILAAVAITDMPGVVTTTNRPTSARFKLGASKDAGLSTAENFAAGDSVIIAGAVYPELSDVGKSGEIYIVIRTFLPDGTESWSYRDGDGYFRPWNTYLANLQPAMTVSSLASSHVAEIFQGLLAEGNHRVYIGYRVQNSSEPLHFTGQAMVLKAI